MKKVAVIVLNFNGREDTVECIESLTKVTKSRSLEIEFIIVDNGSSDNSVETLIKKFSGSILLENGQNLGFSGGMNVGIRYALTNNFSYIMILNNDTIVDKNIIKELIQVAESDEKIGVVVPKIYFAKGYEFHHGRYEKKDLGKVIWYAGGEMDWENVIGRHRGVDEVDHGQFDITGETDFASGCCMMVRSHILKNIGVFDERYFLYYEDNDFSMRVRRAGGKIMFAPRAILWHKNASSAQGSGSTLQDYYITRNRLLFGATYASLRAKAALIRESFKLLASGRKWQRIGVRDFYIRKFGKGSYRI